MRIRDVVTMLLLFSTTSGAAKDKLFVRIMSRVRASSVFEFLKYEDKKFQFELRENDRKELWRLARIAAISFDTSLEAPSCSVHLSESDQIQLRDGAAIYGIVTKLDRGKLQLGLALTGDRRTVPLDSVQCICFNPKVLNIERYEYASGFNLLDSSTTSQMAQASAAEIERQSPMLNDTIVDHYLDSLAKYIGTFSKRSSTLYTCKAINSDVINAFTVGGGKIFIYRGLLETLGSEAELAGVIAHEIGHNVGNHTSQQLSKQLLYTGIIEASGIILNQDHNKWVASLREAGGVVAFFGLMKYSRDDEREADLLGCYNMYSADFDPHGMVTLFDTFKKLSGPSGNILEQWSATHPNPEERQENVSSELAEMDVDGLAQNSERFNWVRAYVSALPPPQLSIPVWVDSMTVSPGNYLALPLDVSGPTIKNPTLKGRFVASGGWNNDIKFHIMDEGSYVNWSNGNKTNALFSTDKVTMYDVDYKFPKPAKYYLVFDNRDAILSSKQVVAEMHLYYTER